MIRQAASITAEIDADWRHFPAKIAYLLREISG